MFLKNKQVDIKKWQDFLLKNDHSSPFQTSEFYNLFNSIPGYSAKVYAVGSTDELTALCVVTIQHEKGLKAYFSRRAIIYGGPLVTSNDTLALLLKNMSADLKGKAIYIETRNLSDYSPFKTIFNEAGWNYEPYLNYHLNCTTQELAWANFNTNRKRQIKKALSSGVKIEEALSLDQVKEYYSILSDLYVNKIKKPLPTFEFFKCLFERSFGKILIVIFNQKIIGGIVCPILKNETIYELYICGLDQEYKDQSPSVMATFAAIEFGYKNGLKKFDFMGAGKPDEDYGVRDFKSKFGGELVEHGRFLKIRNKFLYTLGKTALKLMKRK
jgi:serine/alanine adding enzyme